MDMKLGEPKGMGIRALVLLMLMAGLSPLPARGQAQGGAAAEQFKQAEAFEGQNNLNAAEGIYRKILAADPHNAEALKRLGVLQQTELKFDDSIETLKRALAAHPAYPQVNFFLGLSYYANHDFDNSIASFQQELKTPTAHPATRYYLALALADGGRMDEAIVQLDLVAQKNPRKPDVFYQLARLHMAAAFRAIDQLRSIDPDSFQFHSLMGEFYSQEGHYEAAVSQYQAALKRQPDGLGIHSPLGIAYWNLNKLDLAEKELLLAVKETPDDAYANLYLGRMALRDRELNKALPYLQRAVASHLEELETRILLARCYMGLGQLEGAKTDLIAAASLDPTDPRSHYMLAEIYQKMNQPADRQRELDLFNKLSESQKTKGANDPNAMPENPPGTNP